MNLKFKFNFRLHNQLFYWTSKRKKFKKADSLIKKSLNF